MKNINKITILREALEDIYILVEGKKETNNAEAIGSIILSVIKQTANNCDDDMNRLNILLDAITQRYPIHDYDCLASSYRKKILPGTIGKCDCSNKEDNEHFAKALDALFNA